MSEGKFICTSCKQCRASSDKDYLFRKGIMSHVGRRYDLQRNGHPLRIVVVGQESGLPKRAEFTERVSLETRYRQTLQVSGLERRFYADDGFPGRNPHMRGTTTALRLLMGVGAGTDRESEFIEPANGRRFHLFDGFALVNRLLCSTGPKDTSTGRPTPTMAHNCERHFSATLSILEPTIVVLQGGKVSAWARSTLPLVKERSPHLYESTLGGNRVVVCAFSHPSARGDQRWGERPDAPYVRDVVEPTIKNALRLN
ncbi:hypothetical protein [Nocardioides sp. MH1]|uniref:hypothetical protein n=1 Tax=Nocardioides sp. MH1 TaxID=3242490 RepID=UPI003521D79E